jgi:hypothetical protein
MELPALLETCLSLLLILDDESKLVHRGSVHFAKTDIRAAAFILAD